MKQLYIVIILTFTFSACKLIDKPEEVPSFISVQNFDFDINTSTHGTDLHNITDVWVYVDDNLQGIYELPANKIPINAQGSKAVKLYAGIKKNGIGDTRTRYDFFDPYEVTLDLIPDSIIPVIPVVDYEDDLFVWIEDFEDPGIKFHPHGTSDTTIVLINNTQDPNLIEGDAGVIYLNSTDDLADVRTDEVDFNDLPKWLETPAYLEMHYKSNHVFQVGLLHKDAGLPSYLQTTLITLNPTTVDGEEQWNKIYLYLPDVTNFFQTATGV